MCTIFAKAHQKSHKKNHMLVGIEGKDLGRTGQISRGLFSDSIFDLSVIGATAAPSPRTWRAGPYVVLPGEQAPVLVDVEQGELLAGLAGLEVRALKHNDQSLLLGLRNLGEPMYL